jgi:hypothetical protein
MVPLADCVAAVLPAPLELLEELLEAPLEELLEEPPAAVTWMEKGGSAAVVAPAVALMTMLG